MKCNKQSGIWHFLFPKYAFTLLHYATVFEIGKDVFTNISNLHVSEKKEFGILSPPSDLENVSIQEGEKSSTYTQYMLVSSLLSTFHSVFRGGLSTDFLKGNNQKDRKTNSDL